MILVYPIVEGHGDERALPVLIRRLLENKFSFYEVTVFHPYRLPKGKMKHAQEWPGIVSLACERPDGRTQREIPIAPLDRARAFAGGSGDDRGGVGADVGMK